MPVVDDDRLGRHDLTDEEWARLEPLLPRHPSAGHRWNDRRLVIGGVFHRVRAGCLERDLPERSGNWKTIDTGIAAGQGTGHAGDDPGRAEGWPVSVASRSERQGSTEIDQATPHVERRSYERAGDATA
jgi:hypothetical protein